MAGIDGEESKAAMSARIDAEQSKLIASQEMRSLVEGIVRRKVPAQDVQDVVQTILMAALSSDKAPANKASLRKWLSGVARHKIADRYRRPNRDKLSATELEAEAQSAPQSAREWEQWAKGKAADTQEGKRTLDWLFREGAGEKLAHIAKEESLPATMVRKRVSRLRHFLRQQWSQELAAITLLLLALFAGWRLWRSPAPVPEARQPAPPPTTRPRAPSWPAPDPARLRAQQLRADARLDCQRGERLALERCLRALDTARQIDAAGEHPLFRDLRQQAQQQLQKLLLKEKRKQEKLRQKQSPRPSPPKPPAPYLKSRAKQKAAKKRLRLPKQKNAAPLKPIQKN